MKWLLAVAWVALHNQSIREVLEAWSLAAFGHVYFLFFILFVWTTKCYIYVLSIVIESSSNPPLPPSTTYKMAKRKRTNVSEATTAQKTMGTILKETNRIVQPTCGNGDCFPNAVAAQLPKAEKKRSTRVARELRNKIGHASQQFLPQMDNLKGVWQRGSRSKTPRRARGYHAFISCKGQWCNTFDIALCAYVLRHDYEKRLIVIDGRTNTIYLKLPPCSDSVEQYDVSCLCPHKIIKTSEVQPNDVVVLLRNLHFSATCTIPAHNRD